MIDTIEERRRKTIERRTPTVPPKYRGLYLRVLNNEASPRQCIKVTCLECMGWVRSEVAKCTSVACPLFNKRPFRPASSN